MTRDSHHKSGGPNTAPARSKLNPTGSPKALGFRIAAIALLVLALVIACIGANDLASSGATFLLGTVLASVALRRLQVATIKACALSPSAASSPWWKLVSLLLLTWSPAMRRAIQIRAELVPGAAVPLDPEARFLLRLHLARRGKATCIDLVLALLSPRLHGRLLRSRLRIVLRLGGMKRAIGALLWLGALKALAAALPAIGWPLVIGIVFGLQIAALFGAATESVGAWPRAEEGDAKKAGMIERIDRNLESWSRGPSR